MLKGDALLILTADALEEPLEADARRDRYEALAAVGEAVMNAIKDGDPHQFILAKVITLIAKDGVEAFRSASDASHRDEEVQLQFRELLSNPRAHFPPEES